MAIDDFLADREPNARSGILRPAVQPLENHEDAVEILAVYAYPVVLDCERPDIVALLCFDMYARRRFAPELQSVSNKILEQLDQLKFVSIDRRQCVVFDEARAAFDRRTKIRE